MTRTRMLVAAAAVGLVSVAAMSVPAEAQVYFEYGRPYYRYYDPPVYYYPPPPPRRSYYRAYYPPPAYYYPPPRPRAGFSFSFSN